MLDGSDILVSLVHSSKADTPMESGAVGSVTLSIFGQHLNTLCPTLDILLGNATEVTSTLSTYICPSRETSNGYIVLEPENEQFNHVSILGTSTRVKEEQLVKILETPEVKLNDAFSFIFLSTVHPEKR
jgi:hypothetical protein